MPRFGHACLLLVLLLRLAAGHAAAAPPGLTRGPEGTVLRDGRPYRGVGVNYFGCFLRTLHDPDDRSFEAGFAALGEMGVPFARFCACGFWPRDMQLYLTDREEYFRRMDGVVRAAEKHGVGLIPSLFWHSACVPDLVGEPMDQWGNPASKTSAFVRDYVREMVTRYRESPAIWAWELGNEYNLGADLPGAADHRPPIWPNLGTATSRGPRDDLTYDMLVTAVRLFAEEVRRHDPHRLISNGMSIPRSSAWHNRTEKTWQQDTPEQAAEMLALTAPEPIDLVSVHCYEESLGQIAAAAAAARAIDKPLFVGEFQVADIDSPPARQALADVLAELEKVRVPLAALWVYDHPPHEDFNLTATNGRRWQLEMIGRPRRE